MESYHEDPAELLPELYPTEESSEHLARELEALCKSEPARLVLVFKNADDRAEFCRQVVRIEPQDRRNAKRPAWTLVQNWRTEGGDHVPL